LSLAARAAAAVLALTGCEKIGYIPPDPVEPWPTRVLMHRGGGSCSSDYGAPCPDNTLPAVLYGLSRLDGAEMDIQLSRNGTLWLGHDNEAVDCSGAAVGCFQDLEDGFIDTIAYCDDPATA
jgi:glycerophosphoryl diester phosphodiesterase